MTITGLQSPSTLRRLAVGGATVATLALLLPASASAQNAEVANVLQRFSGEPTVRDTQLAAMRYALIDTDRMENWFTRVRLANIIPGEVRGGFEEQVTDDSSFQTREDLTRSDPEDLDSDLKVSKTQTTVRDDDDGRIKYTVRADWDIGRLIFNPDELDVATEASRQVKLREQVLNTVTKIYFERRRLQVEMVLNPPADTSEAVLTQLRVDELTADLDALTGGWFSQNLP